MIKLQALWVIFRTFLILGCTSFGGPAAHLVYFRQAFVADKKWLSDSEYISAVALCQIIPGPTSSQVGLCIGFQRQGYLGALIAWLAFTLPSALALFLYAISIQWLTGDTHLAMISGLLVFAFGVIAHASTTMVKQFCTDRWLWCAMLISLVCNLVYPSGFTQILLILTSLIIGFLGVRKPRSMDVKAMLLRVSLYRLLGIAVLILSVVLPITTLVSGSSWVFLFEKFFDVGAAVFGGGHVVLPLLEQQFVGHGISFDRFIAGYGAAQAVPGPLFTFAAYLGALLVDEHQAAIGATLAIVAIFLPSWLMVAMFYPAWRRSTTHPQFAQGLRYVNAVVVGFLVAALGLGLSHAVFQSPTAWIFSGLALLLLTFTTLSPAWLAIIFAGLGIVVF